MPRPPRIEFPGAVYHVAALGDRQESIFAHDEDRRTFLDVLQDGLKRFDAYALAYCLLSNQYQLALVTRQANLSRLMRLVNSVYTQRYNRRHQQVGHVFQGRFRAVVVDPADHLLDLCCHVDSAPVREGLVRQAEQWRWSSCQALSARLAPPPWLRATEVWHAVADSLGQTHRPLSAAQLGARYLERVREAPDLKLQDLARMPLPVLGAKAFADRMRSLRPSPDLPGQVPAHPHTLADWLLVCSTRDEAVARTHLESRWTLTRIAEEAGLSLQEVSRVVRGWTATATDAE